MPPPSSVRNVLIYRTGSMSGTVIALPCFHLISRAFPAAQKVLLTDDSSHTQAPAAAHVLRRSGLVDGYIGFKAGTRKIRDLVRLAWRVRRFNPDVMIYLMPVRPAKQVERDRKFFQLAGIRNVIGLPGEAERKHAFDPATGRFEPEASRLARSIRELGDADIDNPASWSLNLASEEKGAAALALGPLMRRPLVACAPGTKMQAKDWGQDNWRLLLSWLQSRFPEFGLALIGSQDDTDVAEFASRDWSGPKVNLCGKLTPRESAAVMEHARIFLGPDSAPMHLAACVGTPCVAVFSARTMPGTRFPVGPVHQAVYHQTSCYGCQLETCVAERRRCLTSIPVNEVADAICRVLERSPEGRITVRGKVVQR